MKNIKERLKKSGLRVTPIREEVLEYFTDQQRALAHADIETNYKNKFDVRKIILLLYIFIS